MMAVLTTFADIAFFLTRLEAATLLVPRSLGAALAIFQCVRTAPLA